RTGRFGNVGGSSRRCACCLYGCICVPTAARKPLHRSEPLRLAATAGGYCCVGGHVLSGNFDTAPNMNPPLEKASAANAFQALPSFGGMKPPRDTIPAPKLPHLPSSAPGLGPRNVGFVVRVAVTTTLVTVAVALGTWAFCNYEYSPWTRDGRIS